MIITCASVLLAKDVHSSMLTQLDGFVFCAVTIEAAFTKIGRDLEPQYWSSMATVLSSLDLAIQEKVTEERSAALCQLTRLKRLALRSVARASNTAEETVASIFLDLPALELLEVYRFGASQVRLNCPKLRGLHLLGLVLTSFSGMPSRIGNVRVPYSKAQCRSRQCSLRTAPSCWRVLQSRRIQRKAQTLKQSGACVSMAS